MGKYRQIVGDCPECEGTTMYDLHNEIVCQMCGLVLHSPGNNNFVSVCIENNIPKIYREGNTFIPKNTHIVSVIDRVGSKMIYLAWDKFDLL